MIQLDWRLDRLEWNYDALATVRTNPAVRGLLSGLGRKYLVRANSTMKNKQGYQMAPHIGPGRYNRAIVNIYTLTRAAKESNSKNQTLAKLLGS